MFPSSGYFSDLPCPYYAHALCERVFCQYSHKLKTEARDGKAKELKQPKREGGKAGSSSGREVSSLKAKGGTKATKTPQPSNVQAVSDIAPVKKRTDAELLDVKLDTAKRARIAHAPAANVPAKPVIPHTANAKVARKLRQQCVDTLFGALARIHAGDDSAACAEALRLEAETYTTATAHNYTSKMRGVLVDVKRRSAGGEPKEPVKPKEPQEKYLYDAIARFELKLTVEQQQEEGYNCLPEEESPPPAIPYAALSQQEREAAYTKVRVCARCQQEFSLVDDATCVYHSGRVRAEHGPNRERRIVYGCCGQGQGSQGCTTRDFHVYEQSVDDLRGFVRTSGTANKAVYALDCEMCYTMDGTELTRVTIINEHGDVVYDTLVRPAAPVLDYNTQFSGITAEKLQGVSTTLADVQRECLRLFSAQTPLIGHSLNSDLKALKLLHGAVVDTAVLYPHPRGGMKHSLRHLAQTTLGRFIQQDTAVGHDSAEDALAALDLVKARVNELMQKEVAQQYKARLQTKPAVTAPRPGAKAVHPQRSIPRPPAVPGRTVRKPME